MQVLPAPLTQPLGLAETMGSAGLLQAISPDGWHVTDAAAAQSFVAAFSGSAAELAWWQAQRIAAVQDHLAALLVTGYTYQGVLIAIDEASQGKITAMAAIASNTIAGLIATPWPATFAWLPQGSGAPLALATPQAMITFGGTIGHYVSACIQYAEALVGQVMAATTTAAVQAIDPTAGWPT